MSQGINTAEFFALMVLAAFVYAAWRVLDFLGAHVAWLPW